MTLSEFFHMGGYAFYVWSSYGLTFIVLGLIFIKPILSKKEVLKELRMKYRQQERQNQHNKSG